MITYTFWYKQVLDAPSSLHRLTTKPSVNQGTNRRKAEKWDWFTLTSIIKEFNEKFVVKLHVLCWGWLKVGSIKTITRLDKKVQVTIN